ncbi:MAG TPA: glutamate--tRNA ligase [Caulobacteraceae bacterium]|jgi:glutamyl-tRNA synthetase|nr:glutamate--tRNA ligase [Caulobacteraceae bacterium]
MSETSAVVTRFAPSPTGFLHIGGARTALFNQLFARHTGGRFLLRIEDTDRARSTDEAVAAIFDGLKWLGIEPDGEPVFQYANADRHRAVVQALLESGGAYRCYMTAEDLDAEREAARAEGRAVRSPWRDRDPPADADAPHVVRFKGPKDGETVIDDLVQGPVRFANKELDDLVLLRTDGAPTYNLAVVVDDHDMGVTHVIRGDDHLNNAARQALIYEALGWTRPAFAHVSLIHGPDGAKLSKRHGAQAVGDFAEMGYLPEALRNYLTRLGWGHGDDEIFDDAQAQAWFDIKDVGRAPARLDWDKLNHVNAHWLRQADDARLTALTTAVLAARGESLGETDRARILAAMPVLKTRAKTVLELADQAEFITRRRPLALDAKAQGLLTEETRARLQRLAEALARTDSWTDPDLELLIKAFADAEGVGLGKIGPALRAVLTGGRPSPDLSKTLAALGREESLGRVNDALSQRT